MTTELEKTFFDTFGIEPKYEDACKLGDEYWNNEHLADEYECFENYMLCKGCTEHIEGCTDNCRHAYTKEIFPQITDRILLELITYLADAFVGNYCIPDVDYINLESNILSDCIKYSNKGYLKEQVQALFKEE